MWSPEASPPDSPDSFGKKQDITSPVSEQIDPPLRLNLEESPDEEFVDPLDDLLLPCAVCNRTFASKSLAKHVRICMQTTPKVRRVFNSSNQRLKGVELSQYKPVSMTSLDSNHTRRDRTPPASNKMPRKQQSTPTIAAHARLLATVESSPCPHCGRNFGARALDKHVTRCAEQARLKHAPGASSGPENVRKARERLQARTQYKAPLAKSKRAINREKYSLSRSASECSGITDHSFNDTRRSSRESLEELKHLPMINKSTKSSGGSVRNKSGMDDMYDPYLAAENQLKDLISSQTNISKLDMSSIPKLYTSKSDPKSQQHSPPFKSKDDSAVRKNPQNASFQRSMSLRSPSRNPSVETKRSPSNKNPQSNFSLNSILYGKPNEPPINADRPKNNLKINSSHYDDSSKLSNHVRLDPVDRKKRKDDNHNDYAFNMSKMDKDYTGSQESIDPRIINEDRPLPITVQKFLDNPDLLSSEESLIRENLPTNFGSYTDYVKKEREHFSRENSVMSHSYSDREPTTPLIDDLSAQYDKIMVSLEKSMTMSSQEEDALYNDLEELMTSIEVNSPNNVREKNEINNKSANKSKNIPYNKSNSLNFNPLSRNNDQYPRSTSFNNDRKESRVRDHATKLEEEIMQSLRDIEDMELRREYENHHSKYSNNVYRQETELKYFMPKNLGIANDSPFLDSSSIKNNNVTSTPKEQNTQTLRSKLLSAAENVPCPNCGHCMDIREWCAEQIRNESLKRPTQLASVDYHHRPSKLHA